MVYLIYQVTRRVEAMKHDMEKRMIDELERQRLAELKAKQDMEVKSVGEDIVRVSTSQINNSCGWNIYQSRPTFPKL